jgi:hypothetical protein
MSEIVMRLVITAMLSLVPFFIFVGTSRSSNAEMVFLAPLFGLIPAVILTLMILVPIEYGLDHFGYGNLKNFVVPLVGGSLIFVFFALRGTLPTWRFVKGSGLWIALGLFWAMLWRLSAWILLAMTNFKPA